MQNGKGILHAAERGETLYHISRKYGVGVTSILYANPYLDVYNLQAGDEIYIPKAEKVTVQTVPVHLAAQVRKNMIQE